MTDEPKPRIWTIGHSTRPIDEFLDVLRAHRIETIVDVRRFPGSRKHPQFGQEALADALARQSIGYAWIEALGGRRRAAPDSPNTGWRNAAFRGYADYMDTAEFAAALERAIAIARERRAALMCAEAVWWRCHRALIADALAVRGFEVVHLIDATHAKPHPMTPPAHVVDGRLSYAKEGLSGALFDSGR